MNDARKYGTTNPVLIEARINHDPYDEFAWVQGWRFAICDALLWDWGVSVPGFSPGVSATEPEDTFELAMIRNLYEIRDGSIPVDQWHVEDELRYALKILDRYREWLGIAGKDY